MLVIAVTFITGNLKDCLTKELILLKHHYSVTPNLNYYGTKTKVEFDGSYLKQDKVTFNQEKVVNIYIVYYEISKFANISKYSSDDNYPISKNALFGAASLTKNADIDK